MAKRSGRLGRPARAATSRVAAAASLRYIESSALLAALLEHDASALAALRADGRYITSALTLAECARAIIRARVAGRLAVKQERSAIRGLRTFERRSYIVDVNRAVLDRVGRPFPIEPIRTLDAVHLATAELLQEPPQLRDGRDPGTHGFAITPGRSATPSSNA